MPSTFTCPTDRFDPRTGLIAYGGRTIDNLMLRSREFEFWADGAGTTSVTLNQAGFDGQLKADEYKEDAFASYHDKAEIVTSLSTGKYCFSCHVKRGVGSRDVSIELWNVASPYEMCGVIIDLDDGSVNDTLTDTWTILNSGAIDIGSGWWRVFISVDVTSLGGGEMYCSVGIANTVGASYDDKLNYLGDNSSSIIFDAGQLESFDASYTGNYDPQTFQETTTSAITKDDDRRTRPIYIDGFEKQMTLVEGERTNELYYNRDWTQYSLTNATQEDGILDVYGELNAVRITATSVSQPRLNIFSLPSPVANDGKTYCFSCWVKDEGTGLAAINIRETGSGWEHYVQYKFADSSFPKVGEQATQLNHGVAEIIGVWHRIYVVMSNDDAGFTGSLAVKFHINDNEGTIFTNIATGIQASFCYPQLEEGTFPSSRIDTNGSAVTRAGETLEADMSLLTSLSDSSNETWFFGFVPHGHAMPSGMALNFLRLGAFTNGWNRRLINRNNTATDAYQFVVRDDTPGAYSSQGNPLNPVANSVLSAGYTIDPSAGLQAYTNGVNTGSNVTGLPKTWLNTGYTDAFIGSGATGTDSCFGYMFMLYFNRVLTAEEILTLHNSISLTP